MPRQARSIYNGEFYHVMTQGINKEYILSKEIYKKIYIKLMYEHAKENHIKIIAYCIMDNHVHILINIRDIENMSRFMKIVNMKFAMLYNKMEDRVGVVFRNRFKSELIYSENYFYCCIHYIHNNPVKAGIVNDAREYKFSSANNYNLTNVLNEIKRRNSNINQTKIYRFIDIEKNNVEDIEEVITDFKERHNLKEIDLDNKEEIKLLVKTIKRKTNVSIREISSKLRNLEIYCI